MDVPPLKASPAAPHAEKIATVGGDSTEERRAPRKDNNSDWMLYRNVLQENVSSVRTRAAVRSGQRRQDVNPSEKAPTGADDGNALPLSKAIPSGPIQLWQEGLPQSSDGGEHGVVSSTEPPPTYLVNLLQFFGWTVTFHDGHRALYTSPEGLKCHSLPKAFETFLRDYAKVEEMENRSSQALDSEGIEAPDLNHQTGLSTQDVVKESLKGRKGRKKRNDATAAAAAPMIPEESTGKQLGAGIQETREKDGKKSALLPEETASPSKEVSQMAITPRVTGQGSNKKKNLHVEGITAPDVNHQTGLSTQDVVRESLKGRKGRKKRNDATAAMAAPMIPQESSGKQLGAGIQETGEKDGKKSSLLPEVTVSSSKEVSQMAITRRVTRQSSNNKMNLHVQLPGPRRSARLSGRYIFYGSNADSEDDTDDSDDANKVCDEKSEACLEHEIPGSKELDCSGETLREKNLSCSKTMHQDEVLLEVRRSDHGSQEHFSVSMEINLDRECSSNFLDSSEILDCNILTGSEEKLMSLAPKMLNVAHEQKKTCNKVDHLMRDAEQFDNSNMVLVVNAQNDSTEIRRYMDLNMKDVSVDDGTGIEMGVDSCFSNSSISAIKSLRSENNEKPNTFEVENTEGGIAEKVVCDMLRAQTESKSRMLKNTVTDSTGEKDLEKCLQQGDNLKVPAPLRCTPLSASKRKPAYGGNSNGKGKKRRGRHGLIVRENVKDDHQKGTFFQNKITTLSWLIDSGSLSENEMLVHKVKNDRADHLRGLATRDGIFCVCCKKIMSLFEFESHAGSYLCQPWYNICLESGKSLMQCQMEAWEKEKKLRRVGFQTVGVDALDPSDDTCGICADGGDLICCDSCPSTFHQDCVMLKDLPEGRWHCPFCMCTFCLAAEGGSDGVNQTSSLFTCQQCYRKYHWECTRESGQHENLAESLLFCGRVCKEVDAGLFGLLGVANKIGEGFSWTLLKRLDEHEELNSDKTLLFMMECNRKLSMALSVLNECFMPVVDLKTGVDLISHAIYNCGSNFKRLNYAGFYNAILEKDDEIISVASLRFHGRHLAEMPFIGTRPMHQRQGMCRRLLKAIEDLLSSLHVKKLIMPATSGLLEIWTSSFSFKPLEQSDNDEIRNLSLAVLPHTLLLQKSIPPKGKECREYDPAGAVVDAGKVVPGVEDLQNDVGMETKSGSCVVGGQSFPSRWSFESSGDRDKRAALQSPREVRTFSSTANVRGGGLLLGSSYGPVSEASPPAQNPPALSRSGVSASVGATCTRFSSFDKALERSFGCRQATGAGDASVGARSHSTVMAKDVHVDGFFPAGYSLAFRRMSS